MKDKPDVLEQKEQDGMLPRPIDKDGNGDDE
jgi:hypothetical protein